jgi:hypothetical protein
MKSSARVLQIVMVLAGFSVAFLLIWEPQIEGVNANRTNFEIYFKDPFIALVYLGSIPFFYALYQVIKILGYIGENNIFSQEAVNCLKRIKYCGEIIIGFVFVEEIFILLNHGNDDPAGGVFMGLLIIFGAGIVSIVAKMFEIILQKVVGMKSENDLKV